MKKNWCDVCDKVVNIKVVKLDNGVILCQKHMKQLAKLEEKKCVFSVPSEQKEKA